MGGIWGTSSDYDEYDIGGESAQLRKYGEPFLREHVVLSPGGSPPIFVDFGCWSGRHMPLLARVAAELGVSDPDHCVVGIDRAEAKRRLSQARRANPRMRVEETGLAHTGLADSSVDAGLSWRVLHNLCQPGQWTSALAEMRRVLKNGAPLVVAVRATLPWMQQEAPIPVLHHTFGAGIDRQDFYFSEAACYAMFRFYGFEVVYDALPFLESETVAGHTIENQYWMLCLLFRSAESNGGADGPQATTPPGRPWLEA